MINFEICIKVCCNTCSQMNKEMKFISQQINSLLCFNFTTIEILIKIKYLIMTLVNVMNQKTKEKRIT